MSFYSLLRLTLVNFQLNFTKMSNFVMTQPIKVFKKTQVCELASVTLNRLNYLERIGIVIPKNKYYYFTQILGLVILEYLKKESISKLALKNIFEYLQTHFQFNDDFIKQRLCIARQTHSICFLKDVEIEKSITQEGVTELFILPPIEFFLSKINL